MSSPDKEVEVLIITTDTGKKFYCKSIKALGKLLAGLKNKDVQISYGKMDKSEGV